MVWWQYLLITIYVLYCVVICKVITKFVKDCKRLAGKIDPDISENYKPFQRTDIHKWNMIEMYIVGCTIFPLRLFAIVAPLAIFCVLCVFLRITSTKQAEIEFPKWKRNIIKFWARFVGQSIVFGHGIWCVKRKQVKLRDFDPSIPEAKPDTKVPIVISNHVCLADIFYWVASENLPSFLSKAELAKYPLIGPGAIGLQSIFVQREDTSNRNATLDAIKKRVDQINEGKKLAPICIFPEGTTSNNRYLLSFKKGAFIHNSPMKMSCLKYDIDKFNPAMDVLGQIHIIVLAGCQLSNSLTVYEFDTFDPSYLSVNNPEEDWQTIANVVKNVMQKCLNIPSTEYGFHDKKTYFEELKEKMKNFKKNKEQ